jgi:hypothetical protein
MPPPTVLFENNKNSNYLFHNKSLLPAMPPTLFVSNATNSNSAMNKDPNEISIDDDDDDDCCCDVDANETNQTNSNAVNETNQINSNVMNETNQMNSNLLNEANSVSKNFNPEEAMNETIKKIKHEKDEEEIISNSISNSNLISNSISISNPISNPNSNSNSISNSNLISNSNSNSISISNSNSNSNKTTEFMALDKILPRRKFLEVIDVNVELFNSENENKSNETWFVYCLNLFISIQFNSLHFIQYIFFQFISFIQ